jgi:hypothetical protein
MLTRGPEPQTKSRTSSEDSIPGHVDILAHLLAAVRVGEVAPDAQEAQLHALVEVGEWHELLPAIRKVVAQVQAESVNGSQREYFEDLTRPAQQATNDAMPLSDCKAYDRPNWV